MNKVDKIIDDSFNLVRIITEAAIIKGSNITPEMIENAKNIRFKTMLYDELSLKGYGKEGQPLLNKNENSNELIEKKDNVLTLKSEPMLPIKKAGFADALILTIIVLVYAAIIINLIIKLK